MHQSEGISYHLSSLDNVFIKNFRTRRSNPILKESDHKLVEGAEKRATLEMMRRLKNSASYLTCVIIILMIVQIVIALMS